MNRSVILRTEVEDSTEAGLSLGRQALTRLGRSPDAMLLFATRGHDYSKLLTSLHQSCEPRVLIGGTVVTAFTHTDDLTGSTIAVALQSDEMAFRPVVTRNLTHGGREGARQLSEALMAKPNFAYLHRSAIVLIDARAQFADAFVEDLNALTGGTYQLFGGGTSDDAVVSGSHLFYGREVLSDAAVALEVLSNQQLGLSVFHGWKPASRPYRVTEVRGRALISLNAQPAVSAFVEHAEATGKQFDPATPGDFFLENILGIELPDGHKLRVPLAVLEDGAILTATELPQESIVRIMCTRPNEAAEIAQGAVRHLRRQLAPSEPELAIFFDCLAAPVRQQRGVGIDVRLLHRELGASNFLAVGTAGQIARADGQFNGFHNSTSVVCAFSR